MSRTAPARWHGNVAAPFQWCSRIRPHRLILGGPSRKRSRIRSAGKVSSSAGWRYENGRWSYSNRGGYQVENARGSGLLERSRLNRCLWSQTNRPRRLMFLSRRQCWNFSLNCSGVTDFRACLLVTISVSSRLSLTVLSCYRRGLLSSRVPPGTYCSGHRQSTHVNSSLLLLFLIPRCNNSDAKHGQPGKIRHGDPTTRDVCYTC